MQTALLFFSPLTGLVYNSDKSSKKIVSNFQGMMVEFLEYHGRVFEFILPRQNKPGRIIFRFNMDVFIEQEDGTVVPAENPHLKQPEPEPETANAGLVH